ncbi:BLUF domain-containing protein [Acinetobacter nectaris]|uniref:BLUF domain-containing protein n=1 Tax=Acinetobacter nectaris TaxID=1219382 RepID=UPI001F215E76|nr:BLUF domain-containing protein [Acinetobacter nectaris]MCF9034607.1 BLUF domain-containing protein [Acinetobacter nectaris]
MILIQLCYASSRKKNRELLSDLKDILMTSTKFNRLNDIFGILYYAHDYFFECLQGERDVVEKRFQTLKKDNRLDEVVLLSKKEISKLSFNSWSMKYFHMNEKIDMFFKLNNYNGFQPTKLSFVDCDTFVDLLIDIEEIKFENKSFGLLANEKRYQSISKRVGYKRRGYKKGIIL